MATDVMKLIKEADDELLLDVDVPFFADVQKTEQLLEQQECVLCMEVWKYGSMEWTWSHTFVPVSCSRIHCCAYRRFYYALPV